VTVRVSEAGSVTCYSLRSQWNQPVPPNESRTRFLNKLETWRYTPFHRDNDAVPVILTEKIYEQESPRQNIAAPTAAMDRVQIELERTGCFGTCPSYHVIIRGDGHVTYKGGEFVDVTGVHDYQIPQDDISKLVATLQTLDIWSLRSSYAAKVTDLPAYTITVFMGNALQTRGETDRKKLDTAFRAAIVGGRLDLVQEIWATAAPRRHPALTFISVTDDDKPIRKTVPVSLLLTHRAEQEGPRDGLKIAQWLAMRGCNIKAARADGDTMLHIAAEAGDAEFVRYLLAKGFDPSTPGHFNLPALGGTQDEDVALLLLEAGTDLSRMNDAGARLRSFAEENHWQRVITWLEAHGSK
jgi:Domain of unknown function (DUF6438)/Ankyrin repeats (3 copies)